MFTLDQLVARASVFAANEFAETGEVNALWVGYTAAGDAIPIVVGAMPETQEQANDLRDTLRAVFAKFDVVQFVNIAEGFALESKEAIAAHDPNASIEHNPDARHIVFIYAENIQGETRCARHYVLKPEHSKPVLSELKDMPAMKNGGAFGNLLHPIAAPSTATKH